MEIIYKGLLKDYKGDYFNGLNISDDIFYIENLFSQKINWEYSEKKKKFYSKIDYIDNRGRFEFIIFKNGYCFLGFNPFYEIKEGDLSF